MSIPRDSALAAAKAASEEAAGTRTSMGLAGTNSPMSSLASSRASSPAPPMPSASGDDSPLIELIRGLGNANGRFDEILSAAKSVAAGAEASSIKMTEIQSAINTLRASGEKPNAKLKEALEAAQQAQAKQLESVNAVMADLNKAMAAQKDANDKGDEALKVALEQKQSGGRRTRKRHAKGGKKGGYRYSRRRMLKRK